MSSILTPQVILLTYWLAIVAIAALFLRLACSLCQADIPSWKRAIVSVVLVTFLAYLTFDFTLYMIMRSMQDVIVNVPPGYGYNHWFREPLALKWMVVGQAPAMLRWLAPIFALCIAGILQVIVLQADVTFRWGLIIFLLQTVATAVAGYILMLVLGVGLQAIGWTPQPVTVAQSQGPSQGPPQQQASAKSAAKGKSSKSSGKKAAASAPPANVASLQPRDQDHQGAGEKAAATVQDVLRNVKNYADSHLEDINEELAPVTRHLPQPVNDFLRGGGWWLVFGVIGIIALLWLRSIVRRIRGAVATAMPMTTKKPRTKVIPINLKVRLAKIGEAVSEEGPTQIVVHGVPARLRLVVMSVGSRNAGALTAEMADRVLDWIKPGLAAVMLEDYPAVHVWPAFFSSSGFASAVAANVVFPKAAGTPTRWAVVVGQVKMGKAVVNVALGLRTEEPTSMRIIKVSGNQWLGVLKVHPAEKAVSAG
jgi:hypothetical protein